MSEPHKPSGLQSKIAKMWLRGEGDRRSKHRVRVAYPVRLRPCTPAGEDFEEVRSTLNVCRDGLYFPTPRRSYQQGMQLRVAFPYSPNLGSLNVEYLAEVVRVDPLPSGDCGIAVHLLSHVHAPR